MNTRTNIAALVATLGALVATGSALAADADPGYPQPAVSVLSRAEVIQATQQAAAAGQLRHGEVPVVATTLGSPKTRAQVHAEALAAIRVGAVSHGEFTAAPTAEQLDSIRMAGERALAMNVASR